MTNIEAIRWACTQLKDLDQDPLQTSRWLLSGLKKQTTAYLDVTSPNEALSDEEWQHFKVGVERLIHSEPLAYILGWTEFYGRRFAVDARVLIPRNDSEALIQAVVTQSKKFSQVADFGAGSGCLGLTLLLENVAEQAFFFDVSADALEVVNKNAVAHGVKDRVQTKCIDLTRLLASSSPLEFDLIVANPPYIERGDPQLQSSVEKYEPHLALFSEKEGFFHIESFVAVALNWLRPGGWYFCEIGVNQKSSCETLLAAQKQVSEYHFFKDLEDRTRGFYLRKRV